MVFFSEKNQISVKNMITFEVLFLPFKLGKRLLSWSMSLLFWRFLLMAAILEIDVNSPSAQMQLKASHHLRSGASNTPFLTDSIPGIYKTEGRHQTGGLAYLKLTRYCSFKKCLIWAGPLIFYLILFKVKKIIIVKTLCFLSVWNNCFMLKLNLWSFLIPISFGLNFISNRLSSQAIIHLQDPVQRFDQHWEEKS